MRLRLSGLPETFNPYVAHTATTQEIIDHMFAGLIGIDSERGIVPQLAETCEISSNRCCYRLKLREGLKWSDGHPLTTADIAFTYEQLIAHPTLRTHYQGHTLAHGQYPGIEVHDDLNITFTLAEPFSPFQFALCAPILPSHVFAPILTSANPAQAFARHWSPDTPPEEVVVNGPWKPDSAPTPNGIRLKPNPYFFENAECGQQLPYLSSLDFQVTPDFAQALKAFNQGLTDVCYLNQAEVGHLTRRDIDLYDLGPTTLLKFITLNQSQALNAEGMPVVAPIKSAWFRNPLFRRALAYGIDKQYLINRFYSGLATPQSSYICSQSPFFNQQTPEYRYHLPLAKKLLAEAGFQRRLNGKLCDQQGHPVSFRLTVPGNRNSHNWGLGKMLKQQWARLGIHVQLQRVSMAELRQRLEQSLDWDAVMLGLDTSALNPHAGIDTWRLDGRLHLFNLGHASYWSGQQATRYTDWEKQILALNEAAASETFERQRELYHQAQVLAAEYLPFIYLFCPLSAIAVSKRLRNVQPNPFRNKNQAAAVWNSDQLFFQTD